MTATHDHDHEVEGHLHEEAIEGSDLWEALGLPMRPEEASWTLSVAAGELPDGSPNVFGIVTIATPNTALRLWLQGPGFDNLIKFLEESKKVVTKANHEARSKITPVKSQLILPGQAPEGSSMPFPRPTPPT